MQTRTLVGIVVGGLVDLGATTVLRFPLVLYIVASRELSRLPAAVGEAAMYAAIQRSAPLFAVSWGLGCVGSVLGGFVAALIAREPAVRTGALSAWYAVGAAGYALVVGLPATPAWQHVLGAILAVVCGAAGGYLRESTRGERTAEWGGGYAEAGPPAA